MIKIVNLSFIFEVSFLAVDELAIASSSDIQRLRLLVNTVFLPAPLLS
ncbi:hypothetical protein [Nostoc sp.]